MSLNATEIVRPRTRIDGADAGKRSAHSLDGDFSTALFTGLNVAVFLVLAGCVAGAAILYGLGA